MLKKPAHYFPLANGRYEVAPGLRPFGFDFGNSVQDKWLFQIDENFSHYGQEKWNSRREGVEKYYPKDQGMSSKVWGPIIEFIIKKLLEDHPEHFELSTLGNHVKLKCHLNNEALSFDTKNHYCLINSDKFRNAFDALAMQVQEDLAVWRLEGNREWLGSVHLSFPNHWDPKDKVGQSFMSVHAPVAHFDKLKAISPKLIKGMIFNGPFVRFAWGIATDTNLNHHPSKPGRSFNKTNAKLFLRTERQSLHPFPDVGASLFTIRTYFDDCLAWTPDKKKLLIDAINSMSEASLVYKGLVNSKDDIIQHLKNGAL